MRYFLFAIYLYKKKSGRPNFVLRLGYTIEFLLRVIDILCLENINERRRAFQLRGVISHYTDDYTIMK